MDARYAIDLDERRKTELAEPATGLPTLHSASSMTPGTPASPSSEAWRREREELWQQWQSLRARLKKVEPHELQRVPHEEAGDDADGERATAQSSIRPGLTTVQPEFQGWQLVWHDVAMPWLPCQRRRRQARCHATCTRPCHSDSEAGEYWRGRAGADESFNSPRCHGARSG